jgi:hypothetical protein
LKGTNESDDPKCVHLWNNIFPMAIFDYGGQPVWNMDIRNNLFVGTDAGDSRSMNMSAAFVGRYPGGTSGYPTIDYNRYMIDNEWDNEYCSTAYNTLAELKTQDPTRCSQTHQHDAKIVEPIFAADKSTNLIPPNLYATTETGGTRGGFAEFVRIDDPRPHPSSALTDAGTPIPILHDGVPNPDIGVYEGADDDLIEYGPSWYARDSHGHPVPVPHCSDGLDNDPWNADGIDYPEDPDCAGPGDPTEIQFNPGFAPPDGTPPSIPGDLSAVASSDSAILLTWSPATDAESGISRYRVYRDGLEVGAPLINSFTDAGLEEATTYTYWVTAVNGSALESGNSDAVFGTTLADTTSPSLVSVSIGGDSSAVAVVFSEPVEEASATSVANYDIDNAIGVNAASLGPDLATVTLTTSPHVEGPVYTLTVNGVRDRAQNPNTIEPDSQASYEFAPQLVISNITTASGLAYEAAENLSVGSLAYIDRTYTYESVPGLVLGASYIKTANEDKWSDHEVDLLSFDVNQNVTLFVAHDDRFALRPTWLGSFVDSGADVIVAGVTYSLFEREYAPGTIVLGGNAHASEAGNNSMYTVIVVGQGGGGDPGDPPLPPTALLVD